MTNLVESSPTLRSTSGALRRVELELDLPAELRVAAFAIDDPGAILAALDVGDGGDAPAIFARKRRAEFLAGRHAAELALRELGLPGHVERGPSGLPLWPAGAVGSITHGAGVACALCAPDDHYRSIGVDVERALQDNEARELTSAVAHPDEIFLLRTALPHASAGQRLAVLFSAKESFFKCLFPLTGTFLEFSDARLVSVGMTSRLRGVLALRLERECGDALARGGTLQARFSLGTRRVESAVLLGKG